MSEEVSVEEVAAPIYGGPYAHEDDAINEAYRNDALDELDTTGFSEGAFNLIENMKYLKDKVADQGVVHPAEDKEPDTNQEPLFSDLDNFDNLGDL